MLTVNITARVAYRALVLTDRWAHQNAAILGALTGGGVTAYILSRLLG